MEEIKNSIKIAKQTKKNVKKLLKNLEKSHPDICEELKIDQSLPMMESVLVSILDIYIKSCEKEIKESSDDIVISKEDLYDVPEVDYDKITTEKEWDDCFKQYEKNFEKLQEIDTRCKERGSIVGRYLDMSVADGKAFYQVQKINQKTKKAFVKICYGMGDGYVYSYFGEESWIDLDFVFDVINHRDKMAEIFAKRK